MPRKLCFFLPNIPVHVVIRGNARRVVFAEAADKKGTSGGWEWLFFKRVMPHYKKKRIDYQAAWFQDSSRAKV